MAITPAGYIAASRIDGDSFLTGDIARLNFHLDIGDRAFLELGKAFNIVMGELDISL